MVPDESGPAQILPLSLTHTVGLSRATLGFLLPWRHCSKAGTARWVGDSGGSSLPCYWKKPWQSSAREGLAWGHSSRRDAMHHAWGMAARVSNCLSHCIMIRSRGKKEVGPGSEASRPSLEELLPLAELHLLKAPQPFPLHHPLSWEPSAETPEPMEATSLSNHILESRHLRPWWISKNLCSECASPVSVSLYCLICLFHAWWLSGFLRVSGYYIF